MRSRHLSTIIRCPLETVYTFAATPDNLTKWASGLVQSKVTHDGELLYVESPEGRTTVRFVARNDLGVLDHDVTLPSGVTTNNPFRVLAHPEGAEVVFPSGNSSYRIPNLIATRPWSKPICDASRNSSSPERLTADPGDRGPPLSRVRPEVARIK